MKQVAAGLWILFLVLGGFAVAVYIHQQPNFLATLQREYQKLPFVEPCAQPLGYTIGTVDSRFGLSNDEVAAKLAAAAKIWNSAAGKEVLTYAPNDKSAIPVNFIYDERQQAVAVGQEIDSTEAAQQSSRDALDADQAKYLAAQETYASAVASFNSDSQAYANEVAQVNSSGGADAATYARLNTEKAALKARQQQLNQQGDALDQQAVALKSRIAAFNADIHNINSAVNDFNSTVGGDFEEGLYVEENGTKRIDIYAYKSQTELLHTLTHEFGHALGLPHNENPASIMFPYNKEGVTLSADDIAALKLACKLT